MPNKIIEKDGNTENVLLDVSQTTAVETDVASGKVFTKVNGVSVTGTLEGGEVPTLNAPTISLNGRTLTITPSYANIVGTKYKYISPSTATFNIYSNGTCIGNNSNSTENAVSFDLDLSSLITAEDTYAITVKASKTNYNDSVASNSVSYTVASTYTITLDKCNLGDGSGSSVYVKTNTAPTNSDDYTTGASEWIDPSSPLTEVTKLYIWSDDGSTFGGATPSFDWNGTNYSLDNHHSYNAAYELIIENSGNMTLNYTTLD